ncbi:unnamed protein product [Heterobilharzia americana]|nr:unnamed protein product [Heterobilharzia americana]
MNASTDNENYNGDLCGNVEDNMSFASNDSPRKQSQQHNQLQGQEDNDCHDQHHSDVQQKHQQQRSPYKLEKYIETNIDQDCNEMHHNSNDNVQMSHESNSNLNELNMDGEEEMNKEDISMNLYRINSRQQSKEIHSNGYHHNQQPQQQHKVNRLSGTNTKACAKKSFVWKYFHHPEIKHGIPDRSRTQCILCDSQLAFNASGTTTTMLNHLKSRHGEVAEQEENLRRFNRDSRKNQLRGMISSSNDCKTSPICTSTGNTILKNNEMTDSFNENIQMSCNLPINTTSSSNKYNRGTLSVGQRGRPPGSGRRQKSMHCPKSSDNVDFLTQDAIPNSNLKLDGITAYSVANYQTGLSDQQKAFLNEMLLSAAAAASASAASLSRGDGRLLNGSFSNPTSSPPTASSPPFLASSTLTTQLPNESNSTKSPFTFLNSVTGLPNISFSLPMNTPQINCVTGVATAATATTTAHELSPSSSSGLGLSSVNSPFETPTTAHITLASSILLSSSSSSSSPNNSLGYRSIASPGGCGGQSNVNSQTNFLPNTRVFQKTKEFSHIADNPLQTNSILMNGQSFNLTDQRVSGSHDATNFTVNMQSLTQNKEKFFNLNHENNENIFDLTQSNKVVNPSTMQSMGITTNSANPLPILNCPSDMMMSAFGSFVSLMPPVNDLNENATNSMMNSSINDVTTINRCNETNMSNHFHASQLQQSMTQSISPQQQQNQQLLMANAWLASLASGKFPNYSNNLVDPCVMFNLLNLNSSTIGNGLNKLSNVSSIASTDPNFTESFKIKNATDINLPINSFNHDNLSFPMNYLITNHNKGNSEETVSNWSKTCSSMPMISNNGSFNNGSSIEVISKFDSVSSSNQFNSNLACTGINLTSNQETEQQHRAIQDGQNSVLSSPSSLPISGVGNFQVTSEIPANQKGNDSDCTSSNNNSKNSPCILPNLTCQSIRQDNFSGSNALPFILNGSNKEINDITLDLSRTSNISNSNHNNNPTVIVNGNINTNTINSNYSCSSVNSLESSHSIKVHDVMSCALDMRSNSYTADHKYSSAQYRNLNPTLSSSAGHTVSTKRKRARPIYISPEQESKRCSTESNPVLDGEDLRMKRYHTETTHSQINTNIVSSVNDKTSCLKTKENLQNIQEQDDEQHEVGGEDRILTSQSAPASSSVTSATSNMSIHSTFSSGVTRNELSYHIAQYLIQDMKPLETIEGEGFQNLLSLFTNHKVPTTKEISEVTFQELFDKVDNRLNQLLANRITESNLINPAISFSIELWDTLDDSRNSNTVNSSDDFAVDNDRLEYANIGVHYTSGQPTTTNNYLYKCLQNPDSESLYEALQKCKECLLSKINLPTNEMEAENVEESSPTMSTKTVLSLIPDTINKKVNMAQSRIQSLYKIMEWPCSVVTNHPESLKKLINQTESNVLILPCLVSELSKALLVGLNTDMIRDLVVNLLKEYNFKMKKHIKENSIVNLSVEEMRKSLCCKAVYNLLKWYLYQSSVDHNNADAFAGDDAIASNKSDLETVKGIISVFETISQTLEFIHKKDLILTGSMIEPILTNLCEIRLACESSDSTTVEEFKSTIASYLINSFPNNGLTYETLWIASLLDPRFKSQVQDKQPSIIKLLKTKVDLLFNHSSINSGNSSTSSSDNQLHHLQSVSDNVNVTSDSNPSSNKHGLETVFGLNYFSRSSLSEVDRYIREDPIGLEEDPYLWWKMKSTNYPNLSLLAMHYLAIPLTCITPERLKPLITIESTEMNNRNVLDVNVNLLTTVYENKNQGKFCSTSLMLLDLPNIVDVFGQGRLSIKAENQIMYNYLWHNWHLTKFV